LRKSKVKPGIEVISDPHSPSVERNRVLYHSKEAIAALHYALWIAAGGMCEAYIEIARLAAAGKIVSEPHPAHSILLSQVQPHHRNGRGGGKRDDRISITLDDGRVVRIALCVCQRGHDLIHEFALLRDFLK
jgi:hypothetical protein